MYFFYMENILMLLFLTACSILFFRASPKNIGTLEKLTRNRILGVIFGYPALLMCIPYAQIVSPAFVQPLLWPIALILPLLCYFYIDYFAARAFAGLLILYAYDAVHYAYELKLRGAILLTITAWLIGIAGIWISGRPCTLRDWFRLASVSRKWAVTLGLAAAVAAIMIIWMLVASLIH